jgi:hypothetical protein
MEDDLNILVNGRQPPKLKIPKQCNLKHIKHFEEKNSTVTSGEPDQHNNQKYAGTIKYQTKSILISFDIIVN